MYTCIHMGVCVYVCFFSLLVYFCGNEQSISIGTKFLVGRSIIQFVCSFWLIHIENIYLFICIKFVSFRSFIGTWWWRCWWWCWWWYGCSERCEWVYIHIHWNWYTWHGMAWYVVRCRAIPYKTKPYTMPCHAMPYQAIPYHFNLSSRMLN